MWKLGLLSLICLVYATVFGQESLTTSSPIKSEAELDRIAEEFLSSFKLAHSKTSRKKRDLNDDLQKLIDDTGVNRLKTIIPVSRLCSPAVYSKFLNVGNETYAICATQTTDASPPMISVGIYKDTMWHVRWRWYVGNPNGLSAFYYKEYIYVLVADSDKDHGTCLVRINTATGKKEEDHTVFSKHATSLSIWKMKDDNKYHLAIANSGGRQNIENMLSEVLVYEWMGTYFDTYAKFEAYDVKDIEPFHIHGTAYLAIANFRRSKNDYKVDSEILKYDLDKRNWISYQKIRTYGAMDWEFFALGSGTSQEFFLAVANKDGGDSNIQTVIYKFVKDRFVPFQCLKSPSAVSISTWSSETTFLLAVASLDAVFLYQYDGWQFVLGSIQYTQGSMSSGVTHLEFHNIIRENVEVVILSISNPLQKEELSVFEIGFQYENALETWNENSLNWCFNLLGNLDSTTTYLSSSLFNDVVFVDQPSQITINGSLYFEGGFQAGTLETPQLKEIITQETYNSDMLLRLKDLQRRLQEIKLKIATFEEVLNNSLKIEGNQTVYGKLRFHDVVLDCARKSCQFDHIKTPVLNGEEIGDWSKNLIFLDSEQVIDGPLFVETVDAKDINVSGMIDGIDSHTLVTRSGDHNITGLKTFMSPVFAQDLEVHGLVDGIKISPADVLLTTGHQTINGHLTFEDIDASWLEIEGKVNGINLTEFYTDVVLSDQPSIITDKKTFHNIIVDNLIMSPGSTINEIDLMDLWENTLWVEGLQKINAPITFNSMSLRKNLNVPQGINGIQIPGPRVVNINEFANVIAPHVFEKPTKIAQLNVMKSLNGLEVFETEGMLPRLDIMLKHGHQLVTGKKTLHDIHLDADSSVLGTVNGVDLSEFKNMVLSRDSSKDPNSVWTFNNLKIEGPLTVNNINGHDIGNIYERALKLNDTNLPDMTFEKILYIDELESYDINGVNIEKDLVLLNKPQNITGRKVFKEIILQENSFVVETINNLNISYLTETVLRIGNQALKSKVFDGNVKFNKLTVRGSINDVPISEFVTLSGNEELRSRELINVTFNEIDANNLEVVGTVNEIDIENMMRDTMTYGGHQEVTGKKTVKGTLHVGNGNELTVNNINGVNIGELWEDSVLLDVSQTIEGTKTFKSLVFFDNLKFKTIDGISEHHMRDWMLKNTPQTVESDVLFLGGLSIRNLSISGLINDIDINKLDASIVKTNEPSVIEGTIDFENNVISNGDVILSGLIQGIDLSEEAIAKFGDKVITGVKTFTRDLIIEKDATVNGYVDGVLIEELCQKALLINAKNITNLTIKGDVTFSRGGVIGGKVAGVDLQKLHEIAVTFADDELTFSGGKTFENLTIEGPVNLEGKLGGVDLQLLNRTYMSLTRNQDIKARMKFDELHFKETLSVKRLNTEDQMINGIDTNSLKRVLRTDTTQTVTAEHYFENMIIRGDVFVAGKVNGLQIPSGLMRHNHTNFIQSSKIFEKPVHVEGDLVMAEGKQIQNVDVSQWLHTAVLKDGGIIKIDGFKTFNNLSLVNAKIGGLLDGLEISEDSLLMTYGKQIVKGRKTIKGNVEIGGSLTVNGLVNGIDLDALATRTLQRGRTNTLTGIKQFNQPLTIDSLEAQTVAGVDIEELKRKINKNLDFELLKNRLGEIGEVVKKMNDALNKQAIVFQYYELFQEFNIPTVYNLLYVYGDDCGELLLLSDNSSSLPHCSSIQLFEYSYEREIFMAHPQELVASFAVAVRTIFVWGSTYLFVANQNINSLCLNGVNIGAGKAASDIYIWNNTQFELFQRIEVSQVSHMVVFYDGNLCCVVYIELKECPVYCSEGHGIPFKHTETLPTSGGRKASVIQADEKIIMAVAAEELDPLNYIEGGKSVDIYFWNFELSVFSSPKQAIGSTFTQSVLLMKYANEYASHVFLAIAEGRIPKVQNEPNLQIYRLDDSSNFIKYQEIKDYGELEWIVLQSGELVLFVLNSHLGKLKLYQYKGASGFVNIDTVHSLGSISIHPFIRHEDKEGMDHFLALAGPRALMAQPSQGTDYAKLLKSKMKGNRYFINY